MDALTSLQGYRYAYLHAAPSGGHLWVCSHVGGCVTNLITSFILFYYYFLYKNTNIMIISKTIKIRMYLIRLDWILHFKRRGLSQNDTICSLRCTNDYLLDRLCSKCSDV